MDIINATAAAAVAATQRKLPSVGARSTTSSPGLGLGFDILDASDAPDDL